MMIFLARGGEVELGALGGRVVIDDPEAVVRVEIVKVKSIGVMLEEVAAREVPLEAVRVMMSTARLGTIPPEAIDPMLRAFVERAELVAIRRDSCRSVGT